MDERVAAEDTDNLSSVETRWNRPRDEDETRFDRRTFRRTTVGENNSNGQRSLVAFERIYVLDTLDGFTVRGCNSRGDKHLLFSEQYALLLSRTIIRRAY